MLKRLIDSWFIKNPRLRRQVTRILERDRNCEVELFGTRLFINSLKEHGYLRAFRRSQMSSLFADEAGVLLSMGILFQNGDTLVDIGANIGLFTASLARGQHLYPNCHFYAFEANPDTFLRLERTIEGLGVKACPLALSDHKGYLDFVEGAVSHVFTTEEHASRYNVAAWKRRVPCDRLDAQEIIGTSLILKIDVEGQELAALEGAAKFFDAERIKAVYIDGYKDAGVVTFLKERGFELFDGRTLAPVGNPTFSLLAVRRT